MTHLNQERSWSRSLDFNLPYPACTIVLFLRIFVQVRKPKLSFKKFYSSSEKMEGKKEEREGRKEKRGREREGESKRVKRKDERI